MTLHDQHIHSSFSHDSQEDLKNYLEYAYKLGCKYFITTEHYDLNVISYNKDLTADFKQVAQTLTSLQKNYPFIKILLGIELGYRKDQLNKLEKILQSEHFDLINLSIHDCPTADFYYYQFFAQQGEIKLLNEYFDIMIEATTNFNNYNVLSHLDYAFKTVYLVNSTIKISLFEDKIKQIFKNLITNQKAFEVNTKVQEAIKDDNHIKYLLNLYYKLGGRKVTLSSDAHSLSRYLSSFDYYKKIIKQCGFNYLVYYVSQKEYQYFI